MKKPSSKTAPGAGEKRQKNNAQQADNSRIISSGPKFQTYSGKIDLMSKRYCTKICFRCLAGREAAETWRGRLGGGDRWLEVYYREVKQAKTG